jgi:hypothetical protein
MALLGNGLRETLTGRMFGSTNVNGGNPHSQEYRGHMAARMRNQFIGEGITDQKASVPSGVRPPVAWVMAPKNGAMSSRSLATLSFTPTGAGAMGVPIIGTTSFSFAFDPAAGQLISSGIGSASMTFTVANLLLTASLNGVGSSAFTITSNTPLLGAKASGIGNAVLSFTASLTPYAIGNMSGSTVDTSTIVNANIVSVNGYSVTGNGQTGTEWGPQ